MMTQEYTFSRTGKKCIQEMDNHIDAVLGGLMLQKEEIEKAGSTISFHVKRTRVLFSVKYEIVISGDVHLVNVLEKICDGWM